MAKKLMQILSDPKRKEVGEEARKTIPIPWEEVVRRVIEEYRNIELEAYE